MSSAFGRLQQARRDDGGATAVEFALVSPVLILFLVGTFEVAWAMHCAASVRWALEKNARVLMLDPTKTADQIKSAMVTQLNGLVDTSKLSVTLSNDTSSGTSMLKAESTFNVPIAIPFMDPQTLAFHASTEVPSP